MLGNSGMRKKGGGDVPMWLIACFSSLTVEGNELPAEGEMSFSGWKPLCPGWPAPFGATAQGRALPAWLLSLPGPLLSWHPAPVLQQSWCCSDGCWGQHKGGDITMWLQMGWERRSAHLGTESCSFSPYPSSHNLRAQASRRILGFHCCRFQWQLSLVWDQTHRYINSPSPLGWPCRSGLPTQRETILGCYSTFPSKRGGASLCKDL